MKKQKRTYKAKGILNDAGFTLIEIVAVALILVTTGTVITGILSSLLRGSNKTRTTNAVGQNGNTTLSLIADIINSSDKVTKINNDPNVTSYCSSSPPEVSSITLRQMTGGETTILCDLANKKIASISADLVTVDLLNTADVQLNTSQLPVCYFKCFSLNNDPYSTPLIEVGFTLQEKLGTGSDLKSSGVFKTSVTLKNFNPN